MTDYDIYTIGWICALRAELVAACELLDEELEGTVPTPAEDNNIYTLGKIRDHHVVIAAMPRGQTGLVNAAVAARDMVRTFPNVRLGFMVGIGGGVPTTLDIRLGDVVVGSPSYQSGGLVQYDHGRAIQDNGIAIMGALNRPPLSILNAITKLSSLHDRKGHKLEEKVEKVLEKNKHLVRKGYGRPHKDTDRLYKADFVHPLGAPSCLTACPESHLVQRQPRESDADSPEAQIHYGLIASGNQLMEDATARDRLAVNENVLCFEMEAAGLANHFPCIAIRGICDYSDSHRGRTWQPYAALIAAAYAKELLLQIPPQNVKEERKIKDILFEFREPIFETNEQVGAIYRSKQREEELKMLDWLQATDYTAQQESFFQQHQPGTGQQFTSSGEFEYWLRTKDTMLFCSGMPGAGKTILTAITVDYLKNRFRNDDRTGVAHVYCSYQTTKKQKVQDLFLSLLKQLAQLQHPFPDALKSLYAEKCNGRERPSPDDITKALRDIIKSFDRVFIVVDAIDEFEATESLFSELRSLKEHTRANILITSRPAAQSLEHKLDELQGCLRKDIQADDHDVKLYVDQRMTEMLVLNEGNTQISRRIKEDLSKLIRERVSEVVNGVFLLARFHLDGLMSKTRPVDIEDALRNLVTGPNAYKDAYEKTIERIANQPEEHRDLARRTLAWLTLAKERLNEAQLRTALSIREGISQLSDRDFESTNVILHVCMGMVKIEEGGRDSSISLLHFTTMEYLQANLDCLLSLESPDQRMIIASVPPSEIERKRKRMTIASPWGLEIERKRKAKRYYEGRIAASCGTYLQFTAFGSGQCEVKRSPGYDSNRRLQDTRSMFQNRLSDYPLYLYAAKNWVHHARETQTRSEIFDFLKSEPHSSASSQLVPAFRSGPLDPDRPYTKSVRLGRVTGLHLAAYFGLDVEAADLLSNGIEPDVRDGWGRTPLSYASGEGHAAVVTQLLGYPVDPESRSDDDGLGSPRTALSHAARQGHAEVVTILLKERRVKPDSTASESGGELNRTPLSFASEAGHVVIVKILLEQEGVDPDSKSPTLRTPLSYAAGAGHLAVAKVLLGRKEVHPDSKDTRGLTRRGRTPLSYAAEGGHKTLVELLLTVKGVDPDSKDLSNRSPLSFAAGSGHGIVVDLLLATKKVDPDSKDNADMTPLCHAAAAGHVSVVKRLLTINQAKPVHQVHDGLPVQYSTTSQTPSLDGMIMLLLANGRVDPDARDSRGWTPLFHAAINGHEATVDILLAQKDVDANGQDDSGRTVLSNAVAYGRATFERLLAHKGLQPDLSDNEGRTPLSYASGLHDTVRMELLLRKGQVNPDARDTSGRTPLSYAAERWNDLGVKLLLNDARVDPNSKDASGRTPLSYAAENEVLKSIEHLLGDTRVDADLEDLSGRTPLSYIAERAQRIIDELSQRAVDDPFRQDVTDSRRWDIEKLDDMIGLIKRMLAEKRANPLFKDNSERTPTDIMPELRYYL
ncbi:ankyrin repeat [Fusarium mexicanum]|uniref:Ankyrin repeat n=1 Tax=Fusarium mexicanum TaxID=751941 RepID=A0A8H5IXZ0_9HYPO|nr:ankyrin repeat [Fusarium mexicanum]